MADPERLEQLIRKHQISDGCLRYLEGVRRGTHDPMEVPTRGRLRPPRPICGPDDANALMGRIRDEENPQVKAAIISTLGKASMWVGWLGHEPEEELERNIGKVIVNGLEDESAIVREASAGALTNRFPARDFRAPVGLKPFSNLENHDQMRSAILAADNYIRRNTGRENENLVDTIIFENFLHPRHESMAVIEVATNVLSHDVDASQDTVLRAVEVLDRAGLPESASAILKETIEAKKLLNHRNHILTVIEDMCTRGVNDSTESISGCHNIPDRLRNLGPQSEAIAKQIENKWIRAIGEDEMIKVITEAREKASTGKGLLLEEGFVAKTD